MATARTDRWAVSAGRCWALPAAPRIPWCSRAGRTRPSSNKLAMNRQYQQLRTGPTDIDQANQDLHARLAQARSADPRWPTTSCPRCASSFARVTAQLAQSQTEQHNSEQKTQALSASLHRQTGVSITPNNSFLQTLPAIHQPDVHVRRDGDVIRIELPAEPASSSPAGRSCCPGRPTSSPRSASELRRNYPDQIIAVEGHTDSDPMLGGQWRNNHELSDRPGDGRLRGTHRQPMGLRPEQLFVVGHGSNHPVVSNATAEGKAAQSPRRVGRLPGPLAIAAGGAGHAAG